MSEARKAADSTTTVIPDKLYFRIGEVAKLLGVETHTLRFWESEFPQVKVGKGGTGQRLYRRRDVETLLEIKQLLYSAGYTIPGARQLLQSRTRKKEATDPKPTDPKPADARAAEEVTPSRRAVGLQRLRADLRELSAQLGKPPVSRPSRWSATAAAQPTRRTGLHLAERPAASAPSRLPSLFDPTEGS